MRIELVLVDGPEGKKLRAIHCKPTNPWATTRSTPPGAIDITRLPEDHQRELYDAFHLRIRYNALTYEIIIRVTLDADTAPARSNGLRPAIAPGEDRNSFSAQVAPAGAPATVGSG